MKFIQSILILAFAGTLLGCATTKVYSGPAKAENQVVKISGMSGWNPVSGFMSTSICAVNNKEIEGCATSVELLPGTHRLKVVAKRFGSKKGESVVERRFRGGERFQLETKPGPKDQTVPILTASK